MNLRTILAAAPAAALLALATCAEPPTQTAADPAGLGAEGSAVPSGPGGELAMANQSECWILSTFGNQHLIGWKAGRPPPDSVPTPDSASTVAVAEGAGLHQAPNVFWAAGNCPAGKLYLEIDSVRGDAVTPDPEPGDFRLWAGTDYINHGDDGGPYWLMTYSPVVGENHSYFVYLALVQYHDGVRRGVAWREDWAGWGHKEQDCWVYYRRVLSFGPYELRDSEACKIPLKLHSILDVVESG